MNARQELAGIMEQWLELSQAEGTAIQKSQWPALKRIQARKSALRESFSRAVRECAQSDRPVLQQFRPKAARLMSLLNRNAAALATALSQARAEQEKLNLTRQNLRRIQRSYASGPSRRTLNSFS